MECELLERLSLWIDGELSPHEERDFSVHLAACAACRAAREDFLTLRADLRVMERPVDAFAGRRTLSTILTGRRAGWWARRIAVPVPVLAVVALVFAISLTLMLRSWPEDGSDRSLSGRGRESGTAGLDLSRYDRGGRAVMVLVPHEAGAGEETR